MRLFENMWENYKSTLRQMGYSEQSINEEVRKGMIACKVLLVVIALTIIIGIVGLMSMSSSSSSSSSSYSSYTSGGCPYTYSDGSRCGREVGKGDTYCSLHTVKKYAHDKKSEDHNNFD